MSKQPIPGYHFQVEWGGTRIGFSEVYGLNIEVQVIEYREGASTEYSPIKLPGITQHDNITLKRGIIPKDNEFFEWLNKALANQAERRDVVINLLNERHNPVMAWRAKKAFPIKLRGPVLNATSNEVAIEILELAHEGLTIESVG